MKLVSKKPSQSSNLSTKNNVQRSHVKQAFDNIDIIDPRVNSKQENMQPNQSKARKAHLEERNLKKAIQFYQEAIKNNERFASSVKELASAFIADGDQEQALNILYRYLPFLNNDYEKIKFKNMITTFERHGNYQLLKKKNIMMQQFKQPDEKLVYDLFELNNRILEIRFNKITDNSSGETKYCAQIEFNSRSAARKTLKQFKAWDNYEIQWVDENQNIINNVDRRKQDENERIIRKNSKNQLDISNEVKQQYNKLNKQIEDKNKKQNNDSYNFKYSLILINKNIDSINIKTKSNEEIDYDFLTDSTQDTTDHDSNKTTPRDVKSNNQPGKTFASIAKSKFIDLVKKKSFETNDKFQAISKIIRQNSFKVKKVIQEKLIGY